MTVKTFLNTLLAQGSLFNSDTATPISEPLSVNTPDELEWSQHCEQLIVGAGLAGCSAALKAAELGGENIILVDRFNGGGTSALSGGVIYAGGGTRVQKELGIADSSEAVEEYIRKEAQGVVSNQVLQRFAKQNASMIDWIESFGVQFSGPLATKKSSYPPVEEFLYYSGNEQVPAFLGEHPPAPRGHRARPDKPADRKKFSGEIMMAIILKALGRQPTIDFMPQSSVRRLIVDKDNRVIGAQLWQLPQGSFVAAQHAFFYKLTSRVMISILGLSNIMWRYISRLERRYAKPINVRATSAVVLTSGGYVNNRKMVQATSPIYAKAGAAGNPGDDGSAMRLAAALKPKLGQLHLISAWRFVSPPTSWIKGIIVNTQGRRIVNEEQYGARLGDALYNEGGGKAWLIVDAAVQRLAKKDLAEDPIWPFQRLPAQMAMLLAKKAPTLSALEAKLGMPPGTLTIEVECYNNAINHTANDPQGKSVANCALLNEGPFYAMNIDGDNPLNPVAGITLGGLVVNEDTGAVCNEAGDDITGLYAAGRAAVGICSENYVSGLSLADAIFSGWRAAENTVKA